MNSRRSNVAIVYDEVEKVFLLNTENTTYAIAIQEGTAMLYPLSCIGAHVSVCPNHAVGRVTPLETRGYVAMAGTFGYELDVTKLSEAEKEEVHNQIMFYHKHKELIREGDYIRLLSMQKGDKADAWMVVDKNKERALVWCVRGLNVPNDKGFFLRLKGLDNQSMYYMNENQITKFYFPLQYASD